MIHPNIMTGEYGYRSTIRLIPMSHMIGGAPDGCWTRGHNIVHMNPMYNDVIHKLNFEPSSTREVNIGSPAINGLVRGHNELVLQLDFHVAVKNNPQRLALQDAVAERAFFGVHHVVITVVGHDIDVASLPSSSVFAKSDGAISQRLAVSVPVRV